MKSIQVTTYLTSVRSRKDGSLGLSMDTPELSPQEKVLFMELQNIECEMVLTPKDIKDVAPEVIQSGFDNKSPSQRLRDTLFVWYKQEGSDELFDNWYAKKMEKIIDWVKTKLE